ncbi:MAG TPA: GNAT family N-acetyltransferase [Acidimicrobiales bacterium]|nr:GNAT family N-acetyltransferase [Acidimicrobiales bacterium]
MDIVIRSPQASEIARLGEIERDGDRRYRGYGGVPEGFDDTAPPAQLERARTDGRLWVGERLWPGEADGSHPHGELVAFALVEPVDGGAHLEQLSVLQALQGRGIGGRLIETVCAWASGQALPAVTLCTFSDVPWNRLLYEHLGFVVLAEDRWTPGLRAVFESDAALGLDLSRRVIMRRPLPGVAPD